MIPPRNGPRFSCLAHAGRLLNVGEANCVRTDITWQRSVKERKGSREIRNWRINKFRSNLLTRTRKGTRWIPRDDRQMFFQPSDFHAFTELRVASFHSSKSDQTRNKPNAAFS